MADNTELTHALRYAANAYIKQARTIYKRLDSVLSEQQKWHVDHYIDTLTHVRDATLAGQEIFSTEQQDAMAAGFLPASIDWDISGQEHDALMTAHFIRTAHEMSKIFNDCVWTHVGFRFQAVEDIRSQIKYLHGLGKSLQQALEEHPATAAVFSIDRGRGYDLASYMETVEQEEHARYPTLLAIKNRIMKHLVNR